ncbi:hypothetical protein EHQ92_03405 [Leptospira biflexa]|jgi:hypothetical protein|uniref:hypothetical protein n=1 Tax=Leptospira biflexa TaxID=172 RepID=UPI000165A91F|nr:hypothetical protein [Leptospira biflexa]ABZ95783.1 Hypothetical protein LBF_3316 [Leptospira biflexa serovar Patoc strain 'Patoc 1 (Ames)']TGM37454.1 hypothetical protein EHQ80_07580 [Leptospira biflexa]TGM40790.1 hypothetical protein EHQ89_02145 [Leptospira biflexa]TGM46991.1 hypothetical protein EHQ92_03405 [Leptospira biflexa]TGM50543.1 hypothetical protein EHQ88_09680 [Leptospira biflexa]
MADSKLHSKSNAIKIVFSGVLFLFFSIQILFADESKLTAKQNKILKETYSYLESLEPKRIKIDKSTYNRHTQFESFFKFPFSGKKISRWIQTRIKKYSFGSTGDFVAMYQDGEVLLGRGFFNLNRLDRILVLLHEARHADGKNYSHVVCPDDFPFLNTRDWKIHPAGKKGCDSVPDGGYGITASFLFELGAYGYLGQTEAAYRYNSEISRVIRD